MQRPDLNQKNIVNDNLLTLPDHSGKEIVQSGAVITCSLLGTDRFVKFCRERGLAINRERLIRLERMRLFSPVFRVRTPDQNVQPFYIPIREENNWFIKKWAWDTTEIFCNYKVPDDNDVTQEGYYSIFQIDYLHIVLQEMTLHVQLDGYLDHENIENINWQKNAVSGHL